MEVFSMFKKLILISLIGVILSVLFGEEVSQFINSLFSSVIFTHHRSATEHFNKKIISKDELKLYNGIEKSELYLALLGFVFDVSKAAQHYGPGQQYNVFVGRDASASFVTGDFNKDDIKEEVAHFGKNELRSLNQWLNFYRKEYVEVGKVIGKYFDELGEATSYGLLVKKLIEEAENAKQDEDAEKRTFPPCNIEWNAESGTKVWCSKNSGGISRNWKGVPRQLYEPGLKSYRCACISEYNEKLGKIKEYENCDRQSDSCFVSS